VQLVRNGEVVHEEARSLEAARARHTASVAELPPAAHQLQRGEPVIETVYEGHLA
jgi:nicotinate phosphoribosyltransferase